MHLYDHHHLNRNYQVNTRDIPEAAIADSDMVGNGMRDQSPLLPLDLPDEASARAETGQPLREGESRGELPFGGMSPITAAAVKAA